MISACFALLWSESLEILPTWYPMDSTKDTTYTGPEGTAEQEPEPNPSIRRFPMTMAVMGIVVAVASVGYLFGDKLGLPMRAFTSNYSTSQADTESAEHSSMLSDPETHLTREAVDVLLDALDQAMRRKEPDEVLRHLAPDAAITIHMRQGTQQQTAPLTREEYGKALAMGFAFPSANDFARTSTTVSLAPDEQSAKVSFKSTETLLQDQREFTIEGETTLVVGIRDDKPLILSLEQVVPGDST